MALSKKPVTGMKDILPEEMQIRDYVIGVIKDTYGKFGFTSIETPCVENIANLTNKQGGDNEKLIFKILKRGEKLNVPEATTEEEIVDGGLRYDLTVPLVRYYSNNSANLPTPFKALQMGNVWRADRPQRGRYRQFMQCDIDILGESSNLAEIELILATTTTISKLGFRNFQIRINDRRILKEEQCKKYLELFTAIQSAQDGISCLCEKLGEYLDSEVMASFREIVSSVKATQADTFELVFDPTLVRGMSYYTGTIFEIAMPEFGGSCGGGGRYDKMVGKFTGNDVPACGFSIGFERIVLLLMESGFKVPTAPAKVAYLIEKGVTGEQLCEIISKAQKARGEGKQVLVARMNKNKKFQKEQLTAEGYAEFEEFYREGLKQ